MVWQQRLRLLSGIAVLGSVLGLMGAANGVVPDEAAGVPNLVRLEVKD